MPSILDRCPGGTHLELHHGDCLDVLARMDSASVGAIITDPPYGISMMGQKWDYDVPSVAIWEQCLRVLKPGGHLLAFAGTRTQHRMCVNIEDAGFEIRDMIAWVYGSGFPKSQNVSKAIDKAAGAEREVIGKKMVTNCAAAHNDGYNRLGGKNGYNSSKVIPGEIDITAPATPEAQQWEGWGTALKPALEPLTVARKPIKGTVANNVLEHGTGAINIDGCRVETDANLCRVQGSNKNTSTPNAPNNGWVSKPQEGGRWPANLIHDGSEEVTELFPDRKGFSGGGTKGAGFNDAYVNGQRKEITLSARTFNDSGSAARFFYTAKASKDDRDKGNSHPTVKPTDLMAYLCRLVTPPGGIVLDPFMGSGTTGKAALSEGFGFIGIERDPEYYAIAESRFNGAQIGLALAI